MGDPSKEWTEADEQILAELYTQYSSLKNKWVLISKEMGRTSESCRNHWRTHKKEFQSDINGTSKLEYGDNSIYIVQASRRIMSQQELMEAYKINPDEWRVEKYIIRTSEGYRKDRSVSWHVQDGQVLTGDVEDSGKMLVVPLYHMELRLVRKTEEINLRASLASMIEDARNYSPCYPVVSYLAPKSGMMYEIAMPDIHFGRLTWHEESGSDYDIKVAERVVKSSLLTLLQYAKNYEVVKILLPIGNDFFNVNSKTNMTVKGTLQQEDTRWQKTFRTGRKLAIEMIDMCTGIAPTDVLIIPGNHDEERTFFLGDALECWYHNNPNVHIDNIAKTRKYYTFGSVLLGFTHGDKEQIKKLPSLMQYEVPKLWGDSTYREWHTGDKHHKTDFIYETDEQVGIVIRILRSLVPEDAWTFGQGFVGSLKAAEAFLWHPQEGLIASFISRVSYGDIEGRNM